MKIAVMGAGALGCYFGGRLAKAGADVSYIARGAHLEAMQQSGLTIESPLGDLHFPQVTATGNPEEIGPVDLVLFLVKMQDTESALPLITPLLGPDTAIMSFQNGVDAWAMIGRATDPARVIGATAAIPADIKAPGVIRHSAEFAKLTFGEFDGAESPRCRALLDLLEKAGVDAALVPDIEVKIWEKFVMLSAFSAVTCLTRLPVGPIRDNPESFALFERAAEETFSVGRKICPDLQPEIIETTRRFLENAPRNVRSSMLDDLTRGKPLELDYLSGAVVRLGEQTGVAVPFHDVVNRALRPYIAGSPQIAEA